MTDDTKPSDPNWDNVNTLLAVIHGAAAAGPKYAYITARAEALLHKHMQEHPEAPAVPPLAPETAPQAVLSGTELPPPEDPLTVRPWPDIPPELPLGDVTPGPDTTASTAIDRRV